MLIFQRSFLFPALLLASLAGSAGAVELTSVQISGVDSELEANVRAQLSLEGVPKAQRAKLSETRLDYLLRVAPAEVQQGLEPYGYYDATVSPEVVRDGDRVTVRLVIVPGEPVMVRTLNLAMSEPARDDPLVAARVAAFRPKPGQLFHHAAYESSKAAIARALGEHGFFDAELESHRVEVTRAQHAADIGLAWRSGRRYAFGAAHFEGQQLGAGVLDPLVPWKPGEPFDQVQLLALQQSLVDSDFSAASASCRNRRRPSTGKYR